VLSRIRQHVDSERKLGDYFSPDIFKATFQNHRTISTRFPKCFHILKNFKTLQSSKNYLKYSEKQIGFSHQRICTSFTYFQSLRPQKPGFPHETGFFLEQRYLYHFDGRSSSESKEPRFRLLEIEGKAVICTHPKYLK